MTRQSGAPMPTSLCNRAQLPSTPPTAVEGNRVGLLPLLSLNSGTYCLLYGLRTLSSLKRTDCLTPVWPLRPGIERAMARGVIANALREATPTRLTRTTPATTNERHGPRTRPPVSDHSYQRHRLRSPLNSVAPTLVKGHLSPLSLLNPFTIPPPW